MKRKINFLVLVVLIAVSATAAVNGDITRNNNADLKADVVLTVVTRHDVTITNEFKEKFLATEEAQNLGITDIDFKSVSTDDGWRSLLIDASKGVDVAWGGGPALFSTMANYKALKPMDDADLVNYLNETVPDRIAGASMKWWDEDDNLLFVASAISSFGFTVNHQFLSDKGLPVPHTWEELASPEFYVSPDVRAISMGDPPETTSNTRIYQIILQAFGWEKGWEIITKMAANAGIYPGSVDTRAAVINGEVGVGMTIDFYGVIAMRENPDCEYIIPEGQSIVNGDPIALGANVDDYEAAKAFIKFVESPEGQSVWFTEGLDRLPVLESAFHTPAGQTENGQALYALYNETLDNEGITFDEELAVSNLDTTIYYFHETITSNHDLLREAWGSMVLRLKSGNITQEKFEELSEQLTEVGMTLNESIDWNDDFQTDPSFASTKRSEWKNFAKQKYNAIIDDIGSIPGTENPTTTPTKTPISTMFSLISFATLVIILRKKRK
ncbi:MAG: ABC transporter substrate-binding protein [Candidatus Heimdallarchaeum endolithica]|uniref:ABC transporter substrate-binding protein n=1 Tax=Candidatus Heimdallarchaeum endolithica TaxID=2876572 RepID=A0A9Y1BTC2_9ARCH|nr:MAG: ABC transporter substrate-binding protein [Candidatus Heimdallarchaeum endolithica]